MPCALLKASNLQNHLMNSASVLLQGLKGVKLTCLNTRSSDSVRALLSGLLESSDFILQPQLLGVRRMCAALNDVSKESYVGEKAHCIQALYWAVLKGAV